MLFLGYREGVHLQFLASKGPRGSSQAAIADSNTQGRLASVGDIGGGWDGLSGVCTGLAEGPAAGAVS